MKNKYLSWTLFTLLLLLLFVAAALLSLTTGVAAVGLGDLLPVWRDGEQMEDFILTRIRLPRIVLALAVGGSLRLSGARFHGVVRSAQVDPYTLRLSRG